MRINLRSDARIVNVSLGEIEKEFACRGIDITRRTVAPIIGNDENEHCCFLNDITELKIELLQFLHSLTQIIQFRIILSNYTIQF